MYLVPGTRRTRPLPLVRGTAYTRNNALSYVSRAIDAMQRKENRESALDSSTKLLIHTRTVYVTYAACFFVGVVPIALNDTFFRKRSYGLR